MLRAKTIQQGSWKYNCCGNLLVYLKGKKDLSYGEELILKGNLSRGKGIWPIIYIASQNLITKAGLKKGNLIRRFALTKKQDEKLRDLCEKTGRKISELARDAIESFVE